MPKLSTNHKAYFIRNLHGIQYFLTLFNQTDENILLLSDDLSLNKFIDKILPYANKIIIPTLSGTFPSFKRPWTFLKQPLEYYLFRKSYLNKFKNKKKPDEAFIFGTIANISFFILGDILFKSGICVHYINAHPEYYNIPFESKNFFYIKYISFLKYITKLDLEIRQCRLWKPYGIAYKKIENLDLLSWDLLSIKFSFNPLLSTDNAILLIDLPIQNYKKILDVPKSRENLIYFINSLLQKGYRIHLKGHYAQNVNSLSRTSIENKIEILPKYFPVEFIMNKYRTIYFFFSAAGINQTSAELISLLPLLTFKNIIEKNKIIDAFSDINKFNNDNIKILKETGHP